MSTEEEQRLVEQEEPPAKGNEKKDGTRWEKSANKVYKPFTTRQVLNGDQCSQACASDN